MNAWQLPVEDRIRRRILIRSTVGNDPDKQRVVLKRSAENPVSWACDWLWTYDPRKAAEGRPPAQPFDLFPKQVELVRWALRRIGAGEDAVNEKSRETGCSYTWLALALWYWLFVPGVTIGLGSRKESLVDSKGDPKSLFWKLRQMLEWLPEWMRPKGFVRHRHDLYMRLLNPANGSVITGEAGDNIGRGGRTTWYLVDEAGQVEHAELVDAALAYNTNTVVWLGTPPWTGMRHLFARKRWSGRYPVFTYHWRDDPRKDEAWYKAQVEQHKDNPLLVSVELDLNYNAGDSKNVVIPGHWVQAAIELTLPVGQVSTSGLDIAAGGVNRSVYTHRRGPRLLRVETKDLRDPTEVALWAADEAARDDANEVRYDAIGVGAGTGGTWKRSDVRFKDIPIRGGAAPSTTHYQDAPKLPANERFANLRAELWWALRERFRRSHEFVNGLATYPFDEMISIPNHADLIAELSQPTFSYTSAGKIKIESKDEMAERGIASPDHADSLVYCFADTATGAGRTLWDFCR